MTPDIRFFQAAATVLPTLLIAAVFTTRMHDIAPAPSDRPALRWWLNTGLSLGLIFFLVIVVAAGETACLTALSRAHPTASQFRWVANALRLEGFVIVMSLIRNTLAPAYYSTLPFEKSKFYRRYVLIMTPLTSAIVMVLYWLVVNGRF